MACPEHDDGHHHGKSVRREVVAGWQALCKCGARSVVFPTDEMIHHNPGIAKLAGGEFSWEK